MWKQWLTAIVLVAIAVGGAWIWRSMDSGTGAEESTQSSASAVNVVSPERDMVRDQVSAVGSLQALEAVELTTEVKAVLGEQTIKAVSRTKAAGTWCWLLTISCNAVDAVTGIGAASRCTLIRSAFCAATVKEAAGTSTTVST